MIELYNKDNIKVYVDSTGYSISSHGGYLFLTDENGYTIVRIPNRKTQGLTITIKGNTLTLEGIMLSCFITNYRYNITLKGEVDARVTQEYRGPNAHTHSLYGSSEIRTDADGLNRHIYILHDSADLQIEGTGSIDTCEVFAYDDSTLMTYTGCTAIIYDNAEACTTTPDAEIYAYDNSTVFSDSEENIYLFDNARRSNLWRNRPRV
jgi:hypothetical protein